MELGSCSYPILIGRGLIKDGSRLQDAIKGDQVLIVTNDVVSPLYFEPLRESLGGVSQVDHFVLPDGEHVKTLASLEKIFDKLATLGHHRTTTLIALGGGVVGDLTGFAAACYQRGVGFIQVPTTLLAQVDASVGGKTAINHVVGKNLIGAFYQPQLVLADMDVLESLPQREYQAGVAELVKHAIIGDVALLKWLETKASLLCDRDPQVLAEALHRSLRVKIKIVTADEREAGIRALLNFGHTFGHALEVVTGYETWLHGEAVALGMRWALDLSVRLGRLPKADEVRINRLLDALLLPDRLAPGEVSAKALEDAMAMDKKVDGAGLPLILLDAMGVACKTTDYSIKALRETLAWATG